MSMPAIFFTADAATAKAFHLNHKLPASDVAELSSVDTLKMSTLWAILDGKPWNVNSLDAFDEIYATESEWLYRFPDTLTQKIAILDDSRLERVSTEWAATEDLQCEPEEAEALFRAIALVAARAIQTHRPLFLYTSL